MTASARRPTAALVRLRAGPLLLWAAAIGALHLAGLLGLASLLRPLEPDRPERLSATYVAELVATAPAAVALAAPAGRPGAVAPPPPVARPRPAARQAPAPEPAASAPPLPSVAPESVPEGAPLTVAEGRSSVEVAESAALDVPPPSERGASGDGSDRPALSWPGEPGAGSTGLPGGPVLGGSSLITAEPLPSFEWPPSTRLSYRLIGHYRGEVHGFAQVEWLREGDRYQVHLDVIIGLPVAPLMSRRMSSDGRLTPEGLVPGRYDEVTRIALRPERVATVRLEETIVQLADGHARARPRGVQDTASQFVQMAYLFALEPGRLTPGRTLELPLALPRRVDLWVYDVLGEEIVETPFGPLAAMHLRPRPLADRRDTLTAEVWIAPTLRFLPVRLLIRQDEQTYMDLVISRRPEIAAR